MDPLLSLFLERVHRQHFNSFPIGRNEHGDYVGMYMKHRLASRFHALNATQALARLSCTSPDGRSIRLNELLSLCCATQSAVIIDRFVRSIHLLNLMNRPERWETVYIPVSMGLIKGVRDDYGKIFREILDRLEFKHPNIAIVLPKKLLSAPALFSEALKAYRAQGFMVAVEQGESGIQACSAETGL